MGSSTVYYLNIECSLVKQHHYRVSLKIPSCAAVQSRTNFCSCAVQSRMATYEKKICMEEGEGKK